MDQGIKAGPFVVIGGQRDICLVVLKDPKYLVYYMCKYSFYANNSFSFSVNIN